MRTNALSLSGALAMALMSTAVASAEDTSSSGMDECRILKQESTLCSAIQYLTNVQSVASAESRIQAYFDEIPSLLNNVEAPCILALQQALCLLEFPKCKGQSKQALPVCLSVRENVAKTCHTSVRSISETQIRDNLFTPLFDSRWASSASIQEPDCVSFEDHGLGIAPIDNIKVENDLKDDLEIDDQIMDNAQDRFEEERWLKEQSVSDLNSDEGGLFEFSPDDTENMIKATLNARHLSRRDRVKHHHHHQQQQYHHHHQQQQHPHRKEKRSAEQPVAGTKSPAELHLDSVPKAAIRADDAHSQGQAVYTVNQEDGGDSGTGDVLIHESLGHTETNIGNGAVREGQQRALMQAGSGATDPAAAAESLGKANAGHPEDKAAADAASAEGQEGGPHKGTVLLAAVPILLIMGAIAGFTVYRRYYENGFNEGGRNDTRDDYPSDGYHRRDLPIRKGSPIHFDRTFLNTIHSPPPTATYLHDPENSSRQQSPSSIASVSMKRPPPSAGSHGKTRFQELSRSYDFGAGFRSIKNALTRSNNNSRESALDQASGSSGSGSSASLNGKGADLAFGAGGHSIAKIGSHPGLNALERQQLQQQYGSGSGSSSSRFPDMNTLTIPQETSIVWGQYSANDDGVYQDAASAVASNLARKSSSNNSLSLLSGGKYSHHHQQSSGHQPDTPTDSIGDCLSPESPSMTREEMMRRRDLYAEGYTFASEGSAADDTHSGTDLLFDARDHFFDIGAEKAAMRDEEMDMYLDMEKEESPYAVDDFNTMNPNPYEPKVLTRHAADTSSIQKTAELNEKESYASRPSLERKDEEFDEKKALEAGDQAASTTVEIEPEETHVLGSASPEWTASGNSSDQAQASVEDVASTEAFGQVQTALGNVNDNSGLETVELIKSEPLDPDEWEESQAGSSSSLPQQSGSQQSLGQGKKKASKSKSKKGRKH